MGMLGFYLRLDCLFVLLFLVCSTPPEDHIRCSSSNNTNCTIENAYGIFPDRTVCKARGVAYPTTEEELVSTVAYGTKYNIPMKAATRYAHSIPKLACPRGEEGLIISTKNLNRVVEINVEELTMTVESGATLRQVISEAAKVGLALPYAPYWWGLTIGGLLGTGAHGSTLWGKGSSVHDYVVGLRLVSPGGPEDGHVKVRSFGEGDKDINAAKVSLGVLGVISQVTLNLQPMFKRSITYLSKNDSDLGDQVLKFGKQHEFADILWYPSQHKAVYRVDDRVSNTSGNGLYDFLPFRATTSLALEVIRTAEENQESKSDADGKCSGAKLVTSGLLSSAYGLTNNGMIFTGYPVIGYQNRLQASGTCLDSLQDSRITACAWDLRIKGEFFHQTTFSISLSVAQSFIQDVQKLVEIEPKSLCGVEIYNGILMRYVTASTAYLGKQEDAIDFDITYYRSKDPMTPRLHEGILEEIEQLALFKYGALPHWGKNRNIAFAGVMKKYKNGKEFLRVKEVYDPVGLFSSEWSDQVLGIKGEVNLVMEGCALEGLCICSEDIHCAPSQAYFCRPGKVFRDARVCTP
ncbi:probable L-gulonolactone oxidase 6 [Rosa rugosa]|uniref:probable L-gulonolactone oxidase 6 n=1 Tax=Rosa rugosa TaxID=74645 RepID=UPI002B400795|nr:probable L-gulonolactone oxidase 6 [Rosa rugosa]